MAGWKVAKLADVRVESLDMKSVEWLVDWMVGSSGFHLVVQMVVKLADKLGVMSDNCSVVKKVQQKVALWVKH